MALGFVPLHNHDHARAPPGSRASWRETAHYRHGVVAFPVCHVEPEKGKMHVPAKSSLRHSPRCCLSGVLRLLTSFFFFVVVVIAHRNNGPCRLTPGRFLPSPWGSELQLNWKNTRKSRKYHIKRVHEVDRQWPTSLLVWPSRGTIIATWLRVVCVV